MIHPRQNYPSLRKRSWRTVVVLLAGSVLVFGFLVSELGVRPGMAAEKEKIEVSEIHRTLEAREKALNERDQELTRRERLLIDKESLLKEQLGRYEVVIEELRKKVRQVEEQDNRRVESFRQIYAQMEPKRAAKILNDMDLDMTGRILSSLKEEKSAQILGRMAPARAREITEKYFARRGKDKRNLAAQK